MFFGIKKKESVSIKGQTSKFIIYLSIILVQYDEKSAFV